MRRLEVTIEKTLKNNRITVTPERVTLKVCERDAINKEFLTDRALAIAAQIPETAPALRGRISTDLDGVSLEGTNTRRRGKPDVVLYFD